MDKGNQVETRRGDIGTKERHNRKELEKVNLDGYLQARVRHVSPCHTYHKRKHITNEQFAAAQELRRCYKVAFEGNHSCEPRERSHGGFKAQEMTNSQVACYQNYCKALDSITYAQDLVRTVVIDEVTIGCLTPNQRKRIMLKNQLKDALDEMAIYFGYMTKKTT